MPSRLPRVNVTVSEEQHGLLQELAKLQGGSAAGYLRQMLDQATPLLRAIVPALRMAAEEMDTKKADATMQLNELLSAMQTAGVNPQLGLLDEPSSTSALSGAERSDREERGRDEKGRAR